MRILLRFLGIDGKILRTVRAGRTRIMKRPSSSRTPNINLVHMLRGSQLEFSGVILDLKIYQAALPMKGTFPSEGSGSRPRAHKAKYNNHTKRGCQCHFVMTRYKDDPDVAVLNFKNR